MTEGTGAGDPRRRRGHAPAHGGVRGERPRAVRPARRGGRGIRGPAVSAPSLGGAVSARVEHRARDPVVASAVVLSGLVVLLARPFVGVLPGVRVVLVRVRLRGDRPRGRRRPGRRRSGRDSHRRSSSDCGLVSIAITAIVAGSPVPAPWTSAGAAALAPRRGRRGGALPARCSTGGLIRFGAVAAIAVTAVVFALGPPARVRTRGDPRRLRRRPAARRGSDGRPGPGPCPPPRTARPTSWRCSDEANGSRSSLATAFARRRRVHVGDEEPLRIGAVYPLVGNARVRAASTSSAASGSRSSS